VAECFFSTIYILLIKTTKKFVKILEDMFVEKKKKFTVLNPLSGTCVFLDLDYWDWE
jgi:UDP-3-O-acyl-N-acetylglucosamine deacetylase